MKPNRIQLDPLWLHHHGGRRLNPFRYALLTELAGAADDFRRSANRQLCDL